jgi:hypothetical protein
VDIHAGQPPDVGMGSLVSISATLKCNEQYPRLELAQALLCEKFVFELLRSTTTYIATSTTNQDPPLAWQVGKDRWKACIVPFPCAAVFFPLGFPAQRFLMAIA